MGQAILHVHTTFSDGLATVEEILDHVEQHSEVDIVGFTDHDDVRAYWQALRWVEENVRFALPHELRRDLRAD